jgi:hypothetical protein
MPPQLVERKSGLFVPASAAAKRERPMARKKFLRLLRDMKFSRQAGLITRFLCDSCKEPVKLHHGEQRLLQTAHRENTINPAKDVFSLECSCSVWTVKS